MHPVTPTVYKFTTIYYNGRRPRETIHPLLPSTERGKERERERGAKWKFRNDSIGGGWRIQRSKEKRREERLAGGRRIACQIVIVLKDRGKETVAWRAKHACNRPGDLRDPISAELCQEIETLSWIAGKIASFLQTILYFPLFLRDSSPASSLVKILVP